MPKTAPPPSAVDRFQADLNRLAPLVPGSGLGLAVSGGPDSTALALLTQHALPHVRLQVAVVDHGLRLESAAEAERVTSWLQARGFAAELLTFQPPDTGVTSAKMERARLARYGLLQTWARRRGLLRVWLGHQADDQRETILMRQEQGSGSEGARGMDRVRTDADVVFERPLLDWPKQALVELCKGAGWETVTDPTNADPRTRRGAMRIAADDEAYGDTDFEAEKQPATLDARAVVTDPLGHAWVRSSALTPAMVQALCAWVRGGHYAPTMLAAQAAVAALAKGARTSLYGCVIEHRSEGWTLVTREARRASTLRAVPTPSGGMRVDDRWTVEQDEGGTWGLLGPDPAADTGTLPARVCAPLLTWNGVAPRLSEGALIWPENRATFRPHRPLFVHRAKEWDAP